MEDRVREMLKLLSTDEDVPLSRNSAAVAVLFKQGGEGPELLLIKRVSSPNDPWSGQISFPGGRWRFTDKKPVGGLSLRELEEETGISREAVSYVTAMRSVSPRNMPKVKATHSASVSQIDPEQVYYLMTRGIPQEEARKMLALGFFEPVVSMVDLDEVRWGIRSLLEGKWGGPVTELFEEPEVTITSLFGTHYKYRYGR
jgi:8-oxo-dGTP pyrophosphatase MutT (NUDIX family)